MIYRNKFFSFFPVWPPSFAVLRINSGPSACKCSTTELHLQPTAAILDIYFFPQQTINKPRSNQSPNVPGIHPPHTSWCLVIWGKEKKKKKKGKATAARSTPGSRSLLCVHFCSAQAVWVNSSVGRGRRDLTTTHSGIFNKYGTEAEQRIKWYAFVQTCRENEGHGRWWFRRKFQMKAVSATQTNPLDIHTVMK